MESILDSIKKLLGIQSDYTVFDPDIIIAINSAFASLYQLGVGPKDGYSISDNSTTWDDFMIPYDRLNFLKSYIYLKVRLLFDPPNNSFLVGSINDMLKELEFRLIVAADEKNRS